MLQNLQSETHKGTNSFPGSFFFPSLAPREGKKKDPGNEVDKGRVSFLRVEYCWR